MKVQILMLGCLLLPGLALAADDDCADLQGQQQMNICAGEAYEKAATKLAEVFGQFRADLEPATQAKLEAAQAKWQQFAEADCAFVSSAEAEGGSMQPMVEGLCLRDRAVERRAFFEHYNDHPMNGF